MQSNLPFGLSFVVDAKGAQSQLSLKYDEQAQLTLALVDDEWVPFVETCWDRRVTGQILAATATFTEIRQETTDADPRPNQSHSKKRMAVLASTRTESKYTGEATDSDARSKRRLNVSTRPHK